MPEITGLWASTYLIGLLSLLAFALGIPVMLLQLNVPEAQRQCIGPYMRRVLLPLYGLIAVTVLAVLAFVWWLHPRSNMAFGAWKGGIAAIIVSLVISATVVIWIREWNRSVRVRVVNYLFDRVERIVQRGRGELTESSEWNHLVSLAEMTEPGYEFEKFIERFASLARTVAETEQYDGDRVYFIVGIVVRILEKRRNGCDEKNLRKTMNMCLEIERRSRKKRSASRSVILYGDEMSAREGLTSVALMAIDSHQEMLVKEIIERYEVSHTQLRLVGCHALSSGYYVVANQVLNKLLERLDQSSTIDSDLLAELVGVIARFIEKSPAAAKQVEAILTGVLAKCKKATRHQILRDAIEYHLAQLDYGTADALLKLM